MDDDTKLQTDIPAFPGSSGSPLFDRQGSVVGMVTGRINRELLGQWDRLFVPNITFATKVSEIRDMLVANGLSRLLSNDGTQSLDNAKRAVVRIVCKIAFFSPPEDRFLT